MKSLIQLVGKMFASLSCVFIRKDKPSPWIHHTFSTLGTALRRPQSSDTTWTVQSLILRYYGMLSVYSSSSSWMTLSPRLTESELLPIISSSLTPEPLIVFLSSLFNMNNMTFKLWDFISKLSALYYISQSLSTGLFQFLLGGWMTFGIPSAYLPVLVGGKSFNNSCTETDPLTTFLQCKLHHFWVMVVDYWTIKLHKGLQLGDNL